MCADRYVFMVDVKCNNVVCYNVDFLRKMLVEGNLNVYLEVCTKNVNLLINFLAN